MMGFVGGVKETEKASQNNLAAICKSISDNILRCNGAAVVQLQQERGRHSATRCL
jgi:hypothetical protein